MLRIRLQPVGKKGQRMFRVVVAHRGSKLNGRPRDRVGNYNPFTKELNVDEEKTRQWIQDGAQPSRTVHNLFVSAGIIQGTKIPVAIPEKAEVEEKQEDVEPTAAEAETTKEEDAENGSGDADMDQEEATDEGEESDEAEPPQEDEQETPAEESEEADNEDKSVADNEDKEDKQEASESEK